MYSVFISAYSDHYKHHSAGAASGKRWYGGDIVPANTKHLYYIYTMLDQRRRRWADVV